MNRYTFEELKINQKEMFAVKITKEMMESFRIITGDNNPLHCDENFAKTKGYDSTVTYGMLTASFLSTLAGVYLPGERSLIQSVETKFVKPVFPNDDLTITGEITEKNETFRIIRIKATITNQDGVKVLKGSMQVGVV